MLYPDLGPSYGDGPDYGIPVTVVKHGRQRFQYAEESDRLRYPLTRDTLIEGGRNTPGDRHALVGDRVTCRLSQARNTRVRDGRRRRAADPAQPAAGRQRQPLVLPGRAPPPLAGRVIENLKQIPASAFVDVSSLRVDPESAEVR